MYEQSIRLLDFFQGTRTCRSVPLGLVLHYQFRSPSHVPHSVFPALVWWYVLFVWYYFRQFWFSINKTLSWKYHIAQIASKISKSIGIIASLRHFVPLNTLHHIYISLIQPYLLYGIVAWGQAAKTYKNKILILQKRALRLMFFGDYNSHAAPYFVSSSFLTLDLLYFKSVAILMHDIFKSVSP